MVCRIHQEPLCPIFCWLFFNGDFLLQTISHLHMVVTKHLEKWLTCRKSYFIFSVSCQKRQCRICGSMLGGPSHHGGTGSINRPWLAAVINFKFLFLIARCHELGYLLKDPLPPRLLRAGGVSDWNCCNHIASYCSTQILYLVII